MDRFDHIFALHRILRTARYPVSTEHLRRELECSESTLRRIVQQMREYFEAPIETSRHDGGGYWYADAERECYELPGLWFSAAELHALIASFELLRRVQPGLLSGHIEPLQKRVEQLLDRASPGSGNAMQRIRILGMAARLPDPVVFRTVAGALLQRRRLALRYTTRNDRRTTQRSVSPQRLTHYRDNWYLDAWCHLRNDLRCFALERIAGPAVQDAPAEDMDAPTLDAHFAAAYGIFAGPADKVAVLRFTPERARWIAGEEWHPRQFGQHLDDGSYELRIPYGDPRELILDILRYGPEVEVIDPPELRQAVAKRLARAAAQYRSSA